MIIYRQAIFGFAEKITPPVLFNLFRKTFLYNIAKNIVNKTTSIRPRICKVSNGILKDRTLYFNGNMNWHKEMIDGTYDNFFFDSLKKNDLKGKTILDVGAHIGYHSLCFAELVGQNGQVITFEPNIFNINYIKENLKNNPELSKRIQLFEIALSEKNGDEDFFFSDKVEEGMSSGSFIDGADTIWEKETFEKKTGYKKVKVKLSTLDSLRDKRNIGIKPDIIKIDVEGAESLVLNGAIDTIKKFSPTILIEIHSIPNMYWVMNFFSEVNYKTELLKKEKDGRCFLIAKKI